MQRLVLALLRVLLLVPATLGAGWLVSLGREMAAPDPPGRIVRTSAGPMHVTEWGAADAPAVLLLHGTGAWGGLWTDTAEALSRAGWRAVAMDLPPFGFTPRAPGMGYARTDQAERIVALAETLDRPVLVAHSFGAGPGVEAAMRRPELFSSLVVVSGAIGLGAEGEGPALPAPLRHGISGAVVLNPRLTGPFLRAFMHRDEAATPETIAILRAPLTGEGMTRGVAEWVPSLLGADPEALSHRPEAWAALDLPLALIWGDRDDVTPLAQGEALAALAPGVTLAVLEDVGHIPQIEAPEAFLDALRAALGRPQEGPRSWPLGRRLVVRVPEAAGRQGQAAASDAAREVVTQRGERGDARV